jgi:hypothetical protein
MSTFEDLPPDVQLHVLRYALVTRPGEEEEIGEKHNKLRGHTLPKGFFERPKSAQDPTPSGVRARLAACKAAARAACVSRQFRRLTHREPRLWERPLAALEVAFEAGDPPSERQKVGAGGSRKTKGAATSTTTNKPHPASLVLMSCLVLVWSTSLSFFLLVEWVGTTTI